MNKDTFLADVQEILQREQSVVPDSRLDGIEEWDSLAMMTMVAYFDFHFQKSVSFPQLKQCATVADLMALAETA
jgi:acyl carrier protein